MRIRFTADYSTPTLSLAAGDEIDMLEDDVARSLVDRGIAIEVSPEPGGLGEIAVQDHLVTIIRADGSTG